MPGWAVVVLVALLLIWVPTGWLRQRLLIRVRPAPPSLVGLHPYALALAFHDAKTTVAAALVRLHRQGVLQLAEATTGMPPRVTVTEVEPQQPTALDLAIVSQLRRTGGLSVLFARDATGEQARSLEQAGVRPDRATLRRCRAAALLPAAVAVAALAGAVMTPVGTSQFLPFTVVMDALAVTGVHLFRASRDARVADVVQAYRDQLDRWRPDHRIRQDDVPDDAALLVAAFGASALDGIDGAFGRAVRREAYLDRGLAG